MNLAHYDKKMLALQEQYGLRLDPQAKIWQLSVGCISCTETALLEVGEYAFDDSNDVGVLEIYDATYELRIIAPQTGELIGTETIETYMDECLSFTLFSDTDEVEQRYGRPHDFIAGLAADYVAP